MSIQNVFQHFVLVDVNVGGWTAEKQLTAEDLGLRKEDLPKNFRLGRKTLISAEIIRQLRHEENAARNLLKNMSRPFPLGQFRAVPKKAMEKFISKFEEIKEKRNKIVKDLVDNFSKYKYEMRIEFVKAAKVAYKRLLQIDSKLLYKKDKDGNPTNDLYSEYEFVNQFLARIETSYPNPQSISSKYYTEFVPFQMELPDLCEATIDDVAEENEKAELIKQGYQARKTKELCNSMMNDLRGYAKTLVEQNREDAKKALTLLANCIKEGKRFSESHVRSVAKMIENFEMFNIVNDDRLEQALKAFKKKHLDTADAKTIRNDNKLQQAMLEDVQKLLEYSENTDSINALAMAYRKKIGLNGDASADIEKIL